MHWVLSIVGWISLSHPHKEHFIINSLHVSCAYFCGVFLKIECMHYCSLHIHGVESWKSIINIFYQLLSIGNRNLIKKSPKMKISFSKIEIWISLITTMLVCIDHFWLKKLLDTTSMRGITVRRQFFLSPWEFHWVCNNDRTKSLLFSSI